MTAENILSDLMDQERAFHQNVEGETCYRALHDDEVHNSVWRQMVVQWCYTVVDLIQADREIVYVAINILDRFLASQLSSPCSKRHYLTDRKDYETAVMTSLLITLKLQGSSTLSIHDLIKMSRNSVTAKDIIFTGKAIVRRLGWNKQIPTAAKFAHALIDLLPQSVQEETKQAIFEQTVYSIELSVHDTRISAELPSLVAWMSLDYAMELEGISKHIIASFRANVVRITKLKHVPSVRRRISNVQGPSNHYSDRETILIGGSVVIPPDDEDNHNNGDHLTTSSDFVPLSRPLNASTVVSMDNLIHGVHPIEDVPVSGSSIIGEKRCTTPGSALPRTKRFRAL